MCQPGNVGIYPIDPTDRRNEKMDEKKKRFQLTTPSGTIIASFDTLEEASKYADLMTAPVLVRDAEAGTR